MRPDIKKNQIGQTLIETMVGIFVLVMGITAALGLATFSLHSSTNIVKQLIGMGLAREGLEAVKNMRDTNWLQDTLAPTGCYDFRTNTDDAAPCYKKWLDPSGGGGYKLQPPGGSKSYRLFFNPSPPNNDPTKKDYYWNFKQVSSQFGMKYDKEGGSDSGLYAGFYYTPSGGVSTGDPDGFGTYYYRQILLTEDSASPYDRDNNFHRIKVQSRVWWTDKNCPQSSTFPSGSKCAIELTMYLTNWKNYQ